jgi:plastocyanin
MHRLSILISILLLTFSPGCAREQTEEAEETGPDTAAVDTTTVARADSVSEWVRQGDTKAIKTPSRKACVFVPDRAIVGLGDSVRFTVSRVSPTDSTLPGNSLLSPGLRSAKEAGRRVFPPVYEFRAYNAANEEIVQFPDTLVFAICVAYDRADSAAFQHALLARDPQDPENSLQLLAWKEPPAQCEFRPSCRPRGSGPPVEEGAVSLSRWLSGSPVVPTPAGAAQTCTTCLRSGIGGGGTSNSPIAAVDTVASGGASRTPR